MTDSSATMENGIPNAGLVDRIGALLLEKPMPADALNRLAAELEDGQLDFSGMDKARHCPPTPIGLQLLNALAVETTLAFSKREGDWIASRELQEKLTDFRKGHPEATMEQQRKEENRCICLLNDAHALKIAKLLLAAGWDLNAIPKRPQGEDILPVTEERDGLINFMTKHAPNTAALLHGGLNGAPPPGKEDLAEEGISFDPEKRRTKLRAHHAPRRKAEAAELSASCCEARLANNIPLVEDALYADDIQPGIRLKAPLVLKGRTVHPSDKIELF